MKNFMAGL